MSYRDNLNSPEWKSKRKEIIQRDNLKCAKCSNANLIKDSLIGLLRYKGYSAKGTSFNFYGYNSLNVLIRKPLFIKKGTTLIPFGSLVHNIAYIDQEYENETFARVIAIRELQQFEDELPTDCYEEKFEQNTYKLKDKISNNYNWKIVPALHVHHTYYQINLKPWEYPNSSLQTLCWVCHERLHNDQLIPFLDENGRHFSTLTPCSRCYGAGWFPQYKHIDEGECFRCRCAKYDELIEPSI